MLRLVPHRAGASRRITMSAFLYRLGRSCARHPFRVLGLWIGALLVVMSVGGSVGGQMKDNFSVPCCESQQAIDTVKAHFPTQAGAGSRVVLHTADARPDDATH